MKLKKITLLLFLIIGLSSCSSDSEDNGGNGSPEITYADVKPTQAKYKAYYGQKVTLSSTLKNAAAAPGFEGTRPVSVIYYPLTNTLSFSNIYDNTTVSYLVTLITINDTSRIYSFKNGNVTYTCTITEKSDTKTGTVVITSAKGSYSFTITDLDKKKITKLLVKDSVASSVTANNYSRRYYYKDTLVELCVYRSKDYKTLADVLTNIKYAYDGSKLVSKSNFDKNDVLQSKVAYGYTNNLITKATFSNAAGTVTGITKYAYDAQKRIILIDAGNADETNSDLIRNHSYEKNQMNTVYTNSNGTFRESEVSIFDDQRKLFFVTQDKILEPFGYLPITKSTYTNMKGQVYDYPAISYEYSADGLLIKTVSEGDVRTLEYREE